MRSATPGKMKLRRQAFSVSAPQRISASKKMTMSAWMLPPPRLPQPPLMALAEPMTFFWNMLVTQACDMTKEAPRRPMAARTATRPCQLCTKPTQKTGMAPIASVAAIVVLGP